jgi:hypothetical protein
MERGNIPINPESKLVVNFTEARLNGVALMIFLGRDAVSVGYLTNTENRRLDPMSIAPK